MIFNQPGAYEPDKQQPMSDVAQEIAARVKEIFYAWNNRKSDDNRGAQTHLGPSEIGTPCDRRLVMSLLGAPKVNPGGDGWAAWMGTQGHAGLAEMFTWADGGSGRFAVETPLEFPSVLVPRGTGDLLDRTVCAFIDHKFMGKWSLNKLRTSGPSDTYRVQVHSYAFGAARRGERVKHVAIIAWPREGYSLDDLYVWAEPYDRKVAEKALKRVESLSTWAGARLASGQEAATVARDALVADDCRYCPYHLKKSTDLRNGCNGKE